MRTLSLPLRIPGWSSPDPLSFLVAVWHNCWHKENSAWLMEWNEQVHDDGRLVTIRLKGEIDLQHSPKLREILQSKLAQRVPALLLDFSEVKHIDSSGLATLIEYYQHSRSYGGRIALAGATERVKSIFDLVRLSEIFQFYPSVELARAGLGSGA